MKKIAIAVGTFVISALFSPMAMGQNVGSATLAKYAQPTNQKLGALNTALSERLLVAAQQGRLREVKRLLKAGADINATDMYGWTALILAADQGHVRLVKYLIKAGADLNIRDNYYGRTALIYAAADGNARIVKLLVDAGADRQAIDMYPGWTALKHARDTNAKIVRLLQESQPTPLIISGMQLACAL